MAEGDSIARLARRLDAGLRGRTVVHSWFGVASLATSDLTGHRLEEVASYGKHLLARLQDPDRPNGGLTLHLHLRMDGRLTIRRARPRPGSAGRRLSLTVDLAALGGTGSEVDLTRPLVVLVGESVPVVDLVRTRDEATVVGHLGPDLCAPGWGDAESAEATLRLGAQPGRPVVEALLDQRTMAGVGNLYAVEGCYLAGLWPWTPVGQLGTERVARLVDLEHRLLSAGVAGSGQATTGDRRPGRSHWVYGRKGRPCRRCGTPVSFSPGDGGPATRPTWWCPHCQPPTTL